MTCIALTSHSLIDMEQFNNAFINSKFALYYTFCLLYPPKRKKCLHPNEKRGRRCRDRMVVGFTTTYAISAYHH